MGGAKILQKIMAPPLFVIKIVKYSGVGGGGGAKILQQIMVSPLSVIKKIKYCGQKYIAYIQYNIIVYCLSLSPTDACELCCVRLGARVRES